MKSDPKAITAREKTTVIGVRPRRTFSYSDTAAGGRAAPSSATLAGALTGAGDGAVGVERSIPERTGKREERAEATAVSGERDDRQPGQNFDTRWGCNSCSTFVTKR